MSNYLRNYAKSSSARSTPQYQPIPGSNQIQNSAGGYSYEADKWTQFNRFLILGTEGGSYYASEKKMTLDNAKVCSECIAEDGAKAVARIVEVSDKGIAVKNDPAIFLLAMAAGSNNANTRQLALAALPKVCRTGTHLFHFADYVKNFRGWGRALCRSIGNWYNNPKLAHIAMQAVKYQSRDGWSHRDLLRLAHPTPISQGHASLFHWITKGELNKDVVDGLDIVSAFEEAKTCENVSALCKLINDKGLPRECIPTQMLNEKAVWEALLTHMPMTAMIRNLATMTKIGLIEAGSAASKVVVSRLNDGDLIHKSRVHPISILTALKTYTAGHGVRGSSSWTPVTKVVDALDDAFYLAFDNVEPTNKSWVLGIDVSGSMDCGTIAGVAGLTPRVMSAALAMVTMRTEKDYECLAFCDRLVTLNISPKQRLDDVCRVMQRLEFGGTDCALPITWATQKKINADVFAIYTDNETWCGDIHPSQALVKYRQTMNKPNAGLAVVGMTANQFSIADPNDPRMMDFVGCGTDTPQVLSMFARGEV